MKMEFKTSDDKYLFEISRLEPNAEPDIKIWRYVPATKNYMFAMSLDIDYLIDIMEQHFKNNPYELSRKNQKFNPLTHEFIN